MSFSSTMGILRKQCRFIHRIIKKGIDTVQKNPELFRVKMDGTDINRCNKSQ